MKVDLAAGKGRQQREIKVTDLGVLRGELMEDAVVGLDSRRSADIWLEGLTLGDSEPLAAARQGVVVTAGVHLSNASSQACEICGKLPSCLEEGNLRQEPPRLERAVA